MLFASYRVPQSFPQPQRELIELFASTAALAIHNAHLQEQRRALREIARRINLERDLDRLLQAVLNEALDLIQCPVGSIAFLNDIGELEFRYAIGRDVGNRLPVGQGLTMAAAKERKAIRVPDVSKDARYVSHVPETKSELDVPLIVHDKLVGVLNFESPRPERIQPGRRNRGSGVGRLRCHRVVQRRQAERLSTLVEVGRELTAGYPPETG